MSTISPKAIETAEAILRKLGLDAVVRSVDIASIIEEHMGNPEGLLVPQGPKRERCADDGRHRKKVAVPISQRLSSARLERGWTQQELANKTGLKVSAVSHFECGKRTPCTRNLRSICIALRVSANWLLDIEEDTPKFIQPR